MQMNFHRKLPIPQEVKKEFPLTERMEQVKASRRCINSCGVHIGNEVQAEGCGNCTVKRADFADSHLRKQL